MKKIGLLTTLLICGLLLTGCNKFQKNPEIILDETQNNSFGIFHNTEEGTITLNNGEESITIMDKNLGAGVAGTGEESFGYYFQRGNNHGFQLNSEIKTGTELVSREESMQYGPNNRYDSDTQFVVLGELDRNVNYHNYNYLASLNDNLRGGSGDSEIVNRMGEYVIDQFKGDTGNPRTERKGPCPEGYHVPSFGEIHKLFKLWIDIKYPDDIEKKEHVRWMSIGGGGNQIGREFSNDLLLPMAGGIRFDGRATPHDQGSEGFYWMSSPGRFLNFHSYMIVEYAESYRAATFPIRCFKNDEENFEINTSLNNTEIQEYIQILSGVMTGENFENNRILSKTQKDGKPYYKYKIYYSGDEKAPHFMEIGFYSDGELINNSVEEFEGTIFFPFPKFVYSAFGTQFQFDASGTNYLDNNIWCRNTGPYLKFPAGSGDYVKVGNNGKRKIYSYENRINHEIGWTPGNSIYPAWIPEQAYENCIIEFDYPDNYDLPFSLGEGLKDGIIAHSKEKGENTHCGWWIKNSYQLITGNIICDISLGDGALFDYFDVN